MTRVVYLIRHTGEHKGQFLGNKELVVPFIFARIFNLRHHAVQAMNHYSQWPMEIVEATMMLDN